MIKFFPKHKEDGIKEVEELGHPVPPGHVQLPQSLWASVTLVRVVPDEKPASIVAVGYYNANKECITGCHGQIVRKNNWFEVVKGRSVLHQPGPKV